MCARPFKVKAKCEWCDCPVPVLALVLSEDGLMVCEDCAELASESDPFSPDYTGDSWGDRD